MAIFIFDVLALIDFHFLEVVLLVKGMTIPAQTGDFSSLFSGIFHPLSGIFPAEPEP